MKIKITRPTEIVISHVEITAPINYGEEEMPKDFPFRTGDVWKVKVNVDTGQIEGWPAGRAAEDLHLTVKDSGTYRLLEPGGSEVGKIDQDYVPNRVVPGQYGDTIELKIDANGVITNWWRKPEFGAFFGQRKED